MRMHKLFVLVIVLFSLAGLLWAGGKGEGAKGEIQVVRLQIHNRKHRRHRSGKLSERIIDVLSLQRNTFPEPFDVNSRRGSNFRRILPWSGGFRVERSAGPELPLA